MSVEILESAEGHLVEGFNFYEEKNPGVGEYFSESLLRDIAALSTCGGVHRKVYGFHRAMAKRFPFGIYYKIRQETILIHAVLDCRRDPAWIRNQLRNLRDHDDRA